MYKKNYKQYTVNVTKYMFINPEQRRTPDRPWPGTQRWCTLSPHTCPRGKPVTSELLPIALLWSGGGRCLQRVASPFQIPVWDEGLVGRNRHRCRLSHSDLHHLVCLCCNLSQSEIWWRQGSHWEQRSARLSVHPVMGHRNVQVLSIRW